MDEAAKQEKESVKKEKQQLIRDRKLKLTEIKRLEMKKRRLAEVIDISKFLIYCLSCHKTKYEYLTDPHSFISI